MKAKTPDTQMNLLFPKQKQYLIIDWSNFVYRAYYTINTHKSSESLDNSAVNSFSPNKLAKVLELLTYMLAKQLKRNPDRAFVAVEGKGKDHRKRLLPEYKAQRETEHAAAISQVQSVALEMLLGTRCEIVKAPEGEADDAIAGIVKRIPKGSSVQIVSEDRDLWQLIRGDRIVVQSQRHGRINEERCVQLMGVPPKRIACLKAYMGDASDNIPRAVPYMRTEHIQKLALLSAIPSNAYKKAVENRALSKKVLERIVKHKERIQTNFEVVRLRDTLTLKSRSGEKSLTEVISRMNLKIDEATVTLLTG
jgi:5'-3' exonuclease